MTEDKTTVCAVCRVTIEIPVRSSSPNESLQDLYRVSKQEAEAIIRNKLPDDFRVVGPVEFWHATVKKF